MSDLLEAKRPQQKVDSCDGASGLPCSALPSPLLANGTVAFFCMAFLNAFFTMVKEYFPPVKQALAGVFGHHWVGHGVIVLITFGILYALFVFVGMHKILKVGNACCQRHTGIGAAVGVVLILGYYLLME